MAFVDFDDLLLKQSCPSKLMKLRNCKVFYGDQRGFHDSEVWILDGKFVEQKKVFFDMKRCADVTVDCKGLIISPGFIDIQVNGAFGVDFSSTSISSQDIDKVANGLLQYGVTAFCPTVISSRSDIYSTVLPKIKDCMKTSHSVPAKATILGAHLEGPFISRDKCGCHPKENLMSSFTENTVTSLECSVKEVIQRVYGDFDVNAVALITVAPELPGAKEAISYFTNTKGVRISIGHSKASFEIGLEALHAGATCVTHIFNAMSPFHHRDAGFIGLLTQNNTKKPHSFYYGIIADGVHVSMEALRLAYLLNHDSMILVTDCISALGLNDGLFKLGDIEVEVKHMSATIKDSNVIAGSVATMPYCIETLMKATNCELDEALQCATWKPACFLGIENIRGSLRDGCRADFVLLQHEVDGTIRIVSVFLNGLHVL